MLGIDREICIIHSAISVQVSILPIIFTSGDHQLIAPIHHDPDRLSSHPVFSDRLQVRIASDSLMNFKEQEHTLLAVFGFEYVETTNLHRSDLIYRLAIDLREAHPGTKLVRVDHSRRRQLHTLLDDRLFAAR